MKSIMIYLKGHFNKYSLIVYAWKQCEQIVTSNDRLKQYNFRLKFDPYVVGWYVYVSGFKTTKQSTTQSEKDTLEQYKV